MSVMKRKILISVAIALICLISLPAQSNSGGNSRGSTGGSSGGGNGSAGSDTNSAVAEITYVEGESFDILDSSGRNLEVDPYNAIGTELSEGVTVLTYENTFIELELLESRHIIKIAENTDFRLESIKSGSETRFRMLYGSVRAKVGKLTRSESFRIKSNEAVAGVRGTDFGMTVVVPREGKEEKPETSVYCFKGEVEVIPVAPNIEVKKPVVIRANEMVSIAPLTEEEPVKVQPIPKNILDYWETHRFRSERSLKSEEEKAPVEKGVVKERVEKREGAKTTGSDVVRREILASIEKYERSRSAYIGAGAVLTTAGFILEGAGLWSMLNPGYVSGVFTFTSPQMVSGSLAVSGGVLFTAAVFTFVKANILKNRIASLKEVLQKERRE